MSEPDNVKYAKAKVEETFAAQKKAAQTESAAHDAAKEAGKHLSKTRRHRIDAGRAADAARHALARLLSSKDHSEFIEKVLGVPPKKKPEDRP